jgi:arylsulfatase A-like enzyme
MQYKHVILVSLDTLRADAITAFGRSQFVKDHAKSTYRTTILDALIKSGTYYSNCISAAPYTSASHAAYFTGCWPKRNGVYEFFNRRLVRPTLFERASTRGWKTVFQTDFPIILGESLGFTRGVHHYHIEQEWEALAQTKRAAQHHNTLSFFHFGGIHYPYGFHRLSFAPRDYPETVKSLEREFDLDPHQLPSDILDESYRDANDRMWLYRYKNILDSLCKKGRYDRIHELYIEGIEYFLSRRFSPFLKELRKFVDQHDALLVLFSDHGESWNAGSNGHANSIDHAVLHVPLLFYGKGIPAHRVVPQLVRTIDLTPTISPFMGLPTIPVDGKMLPGLIKKSDPLPRTAFSQVWRVGDFKKVYEHQQHILKNRKMIRPLKTHLSKEAVYHQDWLLQVWHKEKQNSERFFKRSDADQFVAKRPSPSTGKSLRKFLNQYRHVRTKHTKKVNQLKRKIVIGLQMMGYRI